MKSSRFFHTFAIAILALSTSVVLAQHEDHGYGRGHDKHGNEDEDHDNDRKGNSNKEHGHKGHGYGHGYDDRDHQVMHGWYEGHRGNLPPGLAKRDRLPPGLERQLELRGTLPPGLRGRIYAVPVDLERELPAPPPNCEHVFIGGHVVLLNRRTFVVVDVFHLGF
ncbi:MAG TPA: RcnB family protein [Terriglobales bacterium]|nr:RcnB family protein [Terriglobales bacterium]